MTYDRKHTTYNSYAKSLTKHNKKYQDRFILEQYSKINYKKLINYYKWLERQPKTKAIQFDIDFIGRKLDYHLNLDEHPINYDVVALIRALCSKHKEGRL